MWVCLFAKHQGSVASSEQTSTPQRPDNLAVRGLGPARTGSRAGARSYRGRAASSAPTVRLYVVAGRWYDADACARVRALFVPASYRENDLVVVAGGRGAFD